MMTLFRFLFLVLIVFVVAFATVAFASSQTDQRMGGEAASSVSGWNVSGVRYILAEDPSKLEGVEFDLNAPASVVKTSVSASGVFFDCQNTGRYHWVCITNALVSVSEMNELKVIAAGG